MAATRKPARRRPADSLSDRAYHKLRDRILNGDLPPGAALSRRRLAQEFRMSFLPISEALQRLEIDGLVESKPRVGTRVRVPTPEDVRNRYVLRQALESEAARLFAERATAGEKRGLIKMARQLDRLCSRASAGGGPAQLFHSDHVKFHLRIAEAAGCRLLRDEIEREQALAANWLSDAGPERRALPPRFHSELSAVLASGTPDEAGAAMREHLRFGVEQLVEAIARAARPETWRLQRGKARHRGRARMRCSAATA